WVEVWPGTSNSLYNGFRAKVTVDAPDVGTIIPSLYYLSPGEAPAVFLYNSHKTGEEYLNFLATLPRPMRITRVDATTNTTREIDVTIALSPFKFKVADCVVKVSMLYKGQPVPNDTFVGILRETEL